MDSDPTSGESTGKPLRQTNEYIHPSARSRTVLKGPGVEDEGIYDSEALEDYKVKFTDEAEGQRPNAFWQPRSRRKGSKMKDLPERYVLFKTMPKRTALISASSAVRFG